MQARASIIVALAVTALVGSQGCAAVGIALLGVGIGTAAGQGISYTLDSVAYKTFTAPLEGLETATFRSLERMDIAVQSTEDIEEGRKITAQAREREIEIELDRLTARTSRMRVSVQQGWFVKDRATAAEIIMQTAQTLDDEPGLTEPANSKTSRVQPARPESARGR